MTIDTEPRIGTVDGDTCNRLGCNGRMGIGSDCWHREGNEIIFDICCALCGHSPDDETEEPGDD